MPTIFVKLLNDSTIVLNYIDLEKNTVLNIKELISKRTNKKLDLRIPLKYNNKYILDNHTLSYYDIKRDSTIKQYIPLNWSLYSDKINKLRILK